MSRRDRAHLLTALWNLSGGHADVTVDVADIDEAVGRGHRDMRTRLSLGSLADQNLVVALDNGGWALTARSVAWIVQDRELTGR